MILSIIFILTALIILMTLVLTNKTGETSNSNILLGVTLPHSELKNPEVTAIVQEYHKKHGSAGSIFFVLIFPILFFSHYVSLSMIYLLAWCILLFYVSSLLQKTYFHRLYALKIARGWYVGVKHIISIDTEVSKVKGKMTVSKLWFIFPFLIVLLPGIISVVETKSDPFSWILSIISLLSVMIGCLAYRLIGKARTVIYSEHTEITLALNSVYKYQWTKCWVAEAYIGSILYTLLFFLYSYTNFPPFMMVLFTVISTGLTLTPILSAYHKVRNERNRLLTLDQRTVIFNGGTPEKTAEYYSQLKVFQLFP